MGLKKHQLGYFWAIFDHIRYNKLSWGPHESSCKVSDQLDTRLNSYGIISSKSNYHLKLKSAVSRKRLLGSQKIAIFSTPRGLKIDYLGNSDHIRHGGVKFHTKMNFAYFSKNGVILQSFRDTRLIDSWYN